jgi:hypothetical protein
MKGASSVGNIFSSTNILEQSITYSSIENAGEGYYKIVHPKIWT